MLRSKVLFLLFMILASAYPVHAAGLMTGSFADDTLTYGVSQDEMILYNMINDMRRQNKLQPIPFSADLCIVAHTHIDDLIRWKPQEKGCSLHSWSKSGKWTSCCNSKDPAGIQCMKSKPKEITGYPGNGYELIYWGEEKATPADASALWKQVEASSDMILSKGKWNGFQWKALGVALNDGYAVLWLGDKAEKKDREYTAANIPVVGHPVVKPATVIAPPVIQKKNSKSDTLVKQKVIPAVPEVIIQNTSISGIKYYLIVGSLKTALAADSELKKVKQKGYQGATILKNESNFRIAIAAFDSSLDASVKLKELKGLFPGIWILKQ